MKLLRLDLLAFGPFTDVSLDLSQGQHGLHLIYGPNEAGKSSALRALRQLFFGIEERTPDAFRHPYERLRLGGKVRHSDGTVLEFIRRKARTNPLRQLDDRTVLDAQALVRFFGGVDEPMFKTMFGIDHATLVKEGNNVAKGGGVGNILFAAGSGIADLRSLQDGLQKELDELFKPAGRNQKINQALASLREKATAIKTLQLSSDVWHSHHQALAEAKQQKEQLETALQQQRRQHHRLTRIRDALPWIAKRQELLTALQTCGNVVLLPVDFGDRRRDVLEKLSRAEEQAQAAKARLDQINEEVGRLAVPEGLLEQADKIEELYQRLGEYNKGMKDRPERLLQCKTVEHAAKEILKSLGKPPDLRGAEQLRLRADEPVKINALANQYLGLLANLRNSQNSAAALTSRITEARQEMSTLELPRDPAELRRLVRQIQKQGALEDQLKTQCHDLKLAEDQAAIDMRRLSPWSGTLEALEQLPVPAPETIDRFEKDSNAANGAAEKLSDRQQEQQGALEDLQTKIAKLELEHQVPTEADLLAARQQRNLGWQLVQRVWLAGQPDDTAVSKLLKAFAPAKDLTEAFARSVERADQIADRLRWEADRVANKAKFNADRNSCQTRLDHLTQELQAAQLKQRELAQEWRGLWRPLGVEPLKLPEMRAWLRKQVELAGAAKAIRQQRIQIDRLQEKIDDLRTQLGNALSQLGQPPASPDETLVSLLDRAQEVVDSFEASKNHRQQLERDIADRERELLQADQQSKKAEDDLSNWKTQWAKAVARLGLQEDAMPAEANAFLAAITELFQKLKEADDYHRRINGIDRDTQQFAGDVRALVDQITPDLANQPVERTVEELHTRLKTARAAKQQQQSLRREHGQETEKLRKARDLHGEMSRALQVMRQEASCAAPEELPQAEERSKRRIQLEKDIKQNEEALLLLSAGATLSEFIADAQTVDADSLELDREQIGKRIDSLDGEMSRCNQSIGSEETVLKGMAGSAEAAQVAEDAENVLAQLRSDVQQYAVVRSAAYVLREGIKRFREKYQEPVLARASQLFSELTVGSFAELQIDFNDHAEAVLCGVRSSSKEQVRVEAMSDGSCDQLYLALRLAFLEDYLQKNHEPIPFIVDDILLNFDNDRAVAALRVLAALSQRTQILFFTHHQHLVEMAKREIGDSVILTHDLAAFSR